MIYLLFVSFLNVNLTPVISFGIIIFNRRLTPRIPPF